jgi:murein DD-endopeptidase MepM/ murein hydrolase activator NlpD
VKTPIDRVKAEAFNAHQIADGKLSIVDITDLVLAYQLEKGLTPDGMAGNGETIPAIRAEFVDDGPGFPIDRAWPLARFSDGRAPRVTSGFATRNPSRPTHVGVDVFYPYDAKVDPPMKVGDGGREKAWWIPDGTAALACADGKITGATWTNTGFHVRISFEDGPCSAGYFHLSRLDVAVGDLVRLGHPLGIVGDNPIDKDARHLHFEIYPARTGWNRLDPEDFLVGARLL